MTEIIPVSVTHAGTFRPYRPSNGTEGDMFMAAWCERCALADYDGDGCMIQFRTLMHGIGDPEYPAEWNLTSAGIPQCTAFTADQPADPMCDKTPDMFSQGIDGATHNNSPKAQP